MALRDFLKRDSGTGMVSPLTPEHNRRRAHYDALWNYYRGAHRKNLVVKPGQADDNVTQNWSKRLVNKSVQFLFGPELNFEIDNSDERTAEEEFLDLVWGGTEQRMPLLQKIG